MDVAIPINCISYITHVSLTGLNDSIDILIGI